MGRSKAFLRVGGWLWRPKVTQLSTTKPICCLSSDLEDKFVSDTSQYMKEFVREEAQLTDSRRANNDGMLPENYLGVDIRAWTYQDASEADRAPCNPATKIA
jgi:hypothetical protein